MLTACWSILAGLLPEVVGTVPGLSFPLHRRYVDESYGGNGRPGWERGGDIDIDLDGDGDGDVDFTADGNAEDDIYLWVQEGDVVIFGDGFESGDTSAWGTVVP